MTERKPDNLGEGLSHPNRASIDSEQGHDSPKKRAERREAGDDLVDRIKAGKAMARAAMAKKVRDTVHMTERDKGC